MLVQFFIMLTLLLPAVVYSEDSTAKEVWVVSEGVSYLGDSTTVEAAQRASLDAARRSAIEKGVGAFVTSSTIVHNAQLAEDLVQVIVRGIIVDEQILERGVKIETASAQKLDRPVGSKEEPPRALEQLAYRTKIKAKIVRVPTERHGAFSVAARLNRSV